MLRYPKVTDFAGYLDTRRCPQCKKEFPFTTEADWGWKVGKKCFCSYTCMRKVEKQRVPRETEKNGSGTREDIARGLREERKRIIAMYESGETWENIHLATGCAKATVTRIITHREELKANGYRYVTAYLRSPSEEEIQTAIRMSMEGANAVDIANAIGFSKTTVHRLLHQNGIWKVETRKRAYERRIAEGRLE